MSLRTVAEEWATSLLPVDALLQVQLHKRSRSLRDAPALREGIERLDVGAWYFLRAQIHEDEPLLSRVRVDFEQPVLAFVKVLDVLKCRGFDELASCVVAPTVITASQDSRGPGFLLGDGVRAVSTHIVKGADGIVLPEDQEDGEVGELERVVVAWLVEVAPMSEICPLLACPSEKLPIGCRVFMEACLAKDCTTLKFEEPLSSPPVFGKFGCSMRLKTCSFPRGDLSRGRILGMALITDKTSIRPSGQKCGQKSKKKETESSHGELLQLSKNASCSGSKCPRRAWIYTSPNPAIYAAERLHDTSPLAYSPKYPKLDMLSPW